MHFSVFNLKTESWFRNKHSSVHLKFKKLTSTNRIRDFCGKRKKSGGWRNKDERAETLLQLVVWTNNVIGAALCKIRLKLTVQQYWRAIAFKVSPSCISFVNTIMSSSLSFDVLLRIFSFPRDRSSYTSASSSSISLSVQFPNVCTWALEWIPGRGKLRFWCLPAMSKSGGERRQRKLWNVADPSDWFTWILYSKHSTSCFLKNGLSYLKT